MTHITNNLHEFLRSRRSVRRFKPDPVPDPVIERILTSATYAPSAHNRQPWRFVVVTESAIKSRLGEEMAKEFQQDLAQDGIDPVEIERQITRSKSRLRAAPVVVVLCMDTTEIDTYPDAKRQQAERTMAMQSVAAAGLQLLLAAHAEGLAGTWVCSPLFTPKTVQITLNLIETWEPQGMFYLGFPSALPASRARKPIQEISSFK